MNKQPTTIRTYLLRGLFLIGLVFVIVMPLALGQSRILAGKQSVAASTHTPQVAPPAIGPAHAQRLPILPMPQAPQVVLYDQYNNAGPNATRSTAFTDLPDFSTDLADDFVVPAGQTWNVQSIDADGTYFFGPGPATDWNVFIYTDSGGLPGTQIFSATNQPVVVVGTTFTVNLPVAAVLSAGTYWVEIQANMTFNPQGEWEWTDRMLQSNSGAAIRNPGGAVGCGTDWIRKIFCVSSMPVYRPEWAKQGLTGKGVVLVTIDKGTGKVTGARMLESTGSQLLDGAALQAYSQWRFKPGSVTQLKMPIEFKNQPQRQTSTRGRPPPALVYPLLILLGFAVAMMVARRRRT